MVDRNGDETAGSASVEPSHGWSHVIASSCNFLLPQSSLGTVCPEKMDGFRIAMLGRHYLNND